MSAALTRSLRRALLASSLLPALACGGGGDAGGGGDGGGGTGPTGPDLTVATVAVAGATPNVELGATLTLAASAKNAAGTALAGKSFTWSTSSAATAAVDANGVVTGVALGAATITATEASGKAGTFAVTVVPPAVATVTVSPASGTVGNGLTQQLAATLVDARGNALAGRTVTWASANPAIVTVDANGLAKGVAPGGPVAVTATSEGKVGTAQLTVPAVPVASVAIDAFTTTVTQGATVQLAVTAKDAAGAVLTGRTVTWSSSNAAVAAVSASGLLTAVAAGGPVTITALVEGKSATAAVTVVPRTAARVSVSPRFAVLPLGADSAFRADAFDAGNVAIPAPVTTWTSGAAGTLTVSGAGLVHPVAAGRTTVAAKVNAAADTAVVAVLGPASLLSTAFVGGSYAADVKAGQTITVPVILDLSRASATGDLGAAQLELAYDPALLTYVSATPTATGTTSYNVPSEGTFRFGYAHTSAAGSGSLTLVTVTFTVAANAAVGTVRDLGLSYVGAPTSTSFQSYAAPVTVGGRFRVVAP